MRSGPWPLPLRACSTGCRPCAPERPSGDLCKGHHAPRGRPVGCLSSATAVCGRCDCPMPHRQCTTPPMYANVRSYYGPYAHCSLDKGVAYSYRHKRARAHGMGAPFQVYANTRQPWEHENSIAFGKSTSQRSYSKQRTHKIGKK